jgi:hypothetical protein
MSKKCTLCGGLVAFVGKNVFGEDVFECMLCKEPGHHSRFDDVTLFTQVTQSPEALAEKVVYRDGLIFKSPFIEEMFDISKEQGETREEKYFKARDKAIAATVAKLNEVVNRKKEQSK